MAKPNFIGLPGCEPIPIIFEDRSVLAIDKPRDDFWARSRDLQHIPGTNMVYSPR